MSITRGLLVLVVPSLNYAEHGKGFGSGMGQIGSGHGYAKGGLIPEPVIGFGTQTGDAYQFHQNEWVTPAGRGQGGGPTINMYGNIMLPEGSRSPPRSGRSISG
jgi:hypothetical protein